MVKVQKSSAHGDKLKKLLDNNKLPSLDKHKVEEALNKYKNWVDELNSYKLLGDELLKFMIDKLNEYKNFIDIDLIFDSKEDFLYRQKGQLKLDNTILEEFLPRLFDIRLVPGFGRLQNFECGSKTSFAGLSFNSPFIALQDGGAFIKTKDQDFSVSKSHQIIIKENPPGQDIFTATIEVSYFATEIKTNLDKTMFQEASQTANELKRAVSGCKYILLCEWLDMTPINTKLTSIDEVIILRKAKRISSNIRSEFATANGRRQNRDIYINYVNEHPLNLDCFRRFIFHLNECFPDYGHDRAEVVLDRRYF
ncbi:Bpu10I family restriction endonuclease [Anabaena sp. CCY 9402-a]|uniref:Bpu10I family restriction endonuclease n=1 Tax=Anabaena sp. CCY 9402-a TaxID=3103867 RepID=UPI0039C6AA57